MNTVPMSTSDAHTQDQFTHAGGATANFQDPQSTSATAVLPQLHFQYLAPYSGPSLGDHRQHGVAPGLPCPPLHIAGPSMLQIHRPLNGTAVPCTTTQGNSPTSTLKLPNARTVMAATKPIFDKIWEATEKRTEHQISLLHAHYQRTLEEERTQRMTQLQSVAAAVRHREEEGGKERQRLAVLNEKLQEEVNNLSGKLSAFPTLVQELQSSRALAETQASRIKALEEEKAIYVSSLQKAQEENTQRSADNERYADMLQEQHVRMSRLRAEQQLFMSLRTMVVAENKRLGEDLQAAKDALFKMERILTDRREARKGVSTSEGLPSSGLAEPPTYHGMTSG